MRFTKLFAAGLCLSTLVGFTACNDDDVKIVDNAVPSMDLASTQAWIEGGKDLVVKGVLSDNDGIKYIDIVAPDLLVNKRIDLVDIYGEAPTTYELNYKIGTSYKQIEERDTYPVEITVTDVAGNKTTQNITARLDGDQTAPVFSAAPTGTVTYLVTYGTPASFEINFTVSDNNAIDHVVIELEDVTDPAQVFNIDGFPKTINVGKNLYVHNETVTLPDDQERIINVTITAYDEAVSEESHATAVKAVYKLSQQLPSDLPLYLCDVASAADLSKDVFGVPMAIDNIAPNVYVARYFNEKAGNEVCILGQKGDLGPINIGPSKEDSSIISTNLDNSGKFVLDQAGVYYKIVINTETKEYEVSNYSIEDAIDPIMHMHYGEDDMNTWWETNNMDDIWWQKFIIGPAGDPGSVEGNEMTQDANNPHIFYKENWNLEAGQMNFAIQAWHSHGWWNFETWRVDNSTDPEKFMYYGNVHPDTPHYQGNYDYFEWKYGDVPGFNVDSWGDESYRKQFVPDNWTKPTVAVGGTYKFVFDAHLERAKLVPQN